VKQRNEITEQVYLSLICHKLFDKSKIPSAFVVAFGPNRQVIALLVEANGFGLVQVLHVLHSVRRLAVPGDRNEPINGVPQAGHKLGLPHGVKVG
jgi:hypothetical protein